MKQYGIFLRADYGLVACAPAKSRVGSMSVDLIRTSSSYFDSRKFSSAEVISIGRASRPSSAKVISAEVGRTRPRLSQPSSEFVVNKIPESCDLHGASSQRAASEHTTHKDSAGRRNITSFKQPMPGFELHMPRWAEPAHLSVL